MKPGIWTPHFDKGNFSSLIKSIKAGGIQYLSKATKKSRKRCLIGSVHNREQTGGRYLFLEVKIIRVSCHRRNGDLSSPRDDIGNGGPAGWLNR